MKRPVLIFAFFACSAIHAVGLGGYYESQTNYAFDEGEDSWRIGDPNHRFELRLSASPWTDTEAFVRLAAEYPFGQHYGSQHLKFPYMFTEGHLKYRWPAHAEAMLFSRENRFWFSQGLFELVNADKLKDANSHGARLDFRGPRDITGLAYYSDFSSGEDAAVFRLNAPFKKNTVRLGATAIRKDWGDAASADHNSVISGDVGLSLGEIIPPMRPFGNSDLTGQIGYSRTGDSPSDIGWALELRQLRLWQLELQGGYHDYGIDFRSYLSKQLDEDAGFNEEGFYARAVYLFPTKAVNLTAGYSETRAPDDRNNEISISNPELISKEGYVEAYIEWVNSVSSKFYYKYYRGIDKNIDDYLVYPTLFGEVSLENSLAKVRAQFRAKDFGTNYQLVAIGLELNANLTNDLKLYARVMNVAEIYESRQTAFVQLQYERFRPAEIFLEFGNSGDSDGDLTNDDDFVNEGSNSGVVKQFKLLVKVYF